MIYDSTVNKVIGRFKSATSDYSLSYIGINEEETNKIALRWSNNSISLWVNGVKENEFLTWTPSAIGTLNTLDFYSQFSSGTSYFYGKTKAVQVFKTALTDAELITLTTL